MIDFAFKTALSREFIHAMIIAALGIPAVMMGARWAGKWVQEKRSEHAGMVVRKLLKYTGLTLILISVLMAFHLDLSALLGTAGIASLAIGFAAKTSLSNLIAGIFLIVEKPFEVGDLIQVGQTLGYVTSIDSLSVKIRTPDNVFARIPNENIVQGEVINQTRFDSRRVHLPLIIGYGQAIEQVSSIAIQAAASCSLCLSSPDPMVQLRDLSDGGLAAELLFWCDKNDVNAARSQVILAMKHAYEAAGIVFPQSQAKSIQLVGSGIS